MEKLMNLKTQYLGLELKSPFVIGASPLGDDLDMARRLEDSGAAAIVLHSLFEEQLTGEASAALRFFSSAAFALVSCSALRACSALRLASSA